MSTPHCWHGGAFMRGDGAPNMVCCHCGLSIYFTSTGGEKIPGHGPFVEERAPRKWVEPRDAPACVERQP